MTTIATASSADDFSPSEELLITAKEAARRLAISSRSLWTLTNQRKVPVIRIGRSVRYPVDGLRDWLRRSQGYHSRGGGSKT
jgi:excisionase family DNA binding protein